MGARRRARELALTVLYELEFQSVAFEKALDRIAAEETPSDDVMDFLRLLVSTYVEHKDEVNREIEAHSNNWKIPRMAIVDRNILRLGSAELLFFPDIPKNVTINEYLEIAKKFGTEDSSGFVNGILDKVNKKPA